MLTAGLSYFPLRLAFGAYFAQHRLLAREWRTSASRIPIFLSQMALILEEYVFLCPAVPLGLGGKAFFAYPKSIKKRMFLQTLFNFYCKKKTGPHVTGGGVVLPIAARIWRICCSKSAPGSRMAHIGLSDPYFSLAYGINPREICLFVSCGSPGTPLGFWDSCKPPLGLP